MKGMQITRNLANFNKHQFLNQETQFETGYIDLQNRQYDPQRGQFTSIDALAELNRKFSPAVYGNNNPLRFIDPDGMQAVGADGLTDDQWVSARGDSDQEQESRQDNRNKENGSKNKGKTVMVAFSGLDASKKGETGTAGDIINQLNAWSKSNKRNFLGKAVASAPGDVASLKAAIEFIRSNYDIGSNDQLYVYGYSWGGDNAVELSQMLNDIGINVNLLVTVDGAKGPVSGGIIGDFVDREIPSNVSKNINFYQTNFFFNSNNDSNRGIFSRGNPNIAQDPTKTTVLNSKWNHTFHSTIDDSTKGVVTKFIQRILSK